ncbi:MAG: tripartite tricarboxylate transporter TctB family protein [Dehalococcoidales bacterium]|nr:tripartite tricarboxylate transporter TctB family protein [Dehalococcoidales bacterium]
MNIYLHRLVAWICISFEIFTIVFTGMLILPKPVEATAVTEVTISPTVDNRVGQFSTTTATWTNFWNGNAAGAFQNVVGGSFFSSGLYATATANQWNVKIGCFVIDISTIPDDATIQYITVRAKIFGMSNETSQPLYYAIYKSKPPTDQTNGYPASGDTYNWKQGAVTRISSVEAQEDYSVGDWMEFNIMTDYLQTGFDRSKKYVSVYIMSTYAGMNVIPLYVTSKADTVSFESTNYPAGNFHPPQVIFGYVSGAEDRVYDGGSNAGVDVLVDDTETVSGVSWISPRCAFADEKLGFLFQGQSGAVVDASLVDGNGTIVKTIKDSIRVDGNFYWYVDVPENTDNYFRVVLNDGHSTDWGYISPKPPSDEWATGETLSIYSTYPHYSRPFSDFQVKSNEPFKVFYKTSITGANLDDYELQLWHNGDDADAVYSETLQYLKTNYFKNDSDANNLLGWRFVIFVMDGSATGFDDKDGLIIDLSKTLVTANYGFYQPVIYQTGVGEYSLTHSSFWYVPNVEDTITLKLDKTKYGMGETVKATILISGNTGAITTMPDYTLEIRDFNTTNTFETKTGTISGGTTNVELNASGDVGYKYAFLTLTDSDITYEFKQRVKFMTAISASGTNKENLVDKVNTLADTHGMKDNGSKALVVLVLEAIIFVVILFVKEKIMKWLGVLMMVIVFVAAIAMGWLNPIIVIPVAIVFGLILWKSLRPAHGGSE